MAKEINFKVRLTVDGKEQLVTATSSVAELRKVMEDAKGSAGQFRDKLLAFTQSVQKMQQVSSAVSQIAGTLNSATAESRSFGAAMKAANTMAGKDAAGFKVLKGQVAELAADIPIARDALANGLYQVISNGVPEDNWISYLEASAKSAIGGIADVGEVVKVTSTIIKNYGLEWSAAQDIQDKIQLTAKNGVTSFEQLAAALPSVTGQAAQLGVSFSEMLAVMSTLTGVTGNTSEVATQLSSVLTALTKESSKAQKMAAEMGIEFNAASIKAAGGLRNYLQELDKTITAYSQKSGELKESIYAKLFGRAEALRLTNALTGQLAEKFDENIRQLDASAGTMAKAYSDMASTGAASLQKLKNYWSQYTDHIASVVSRILPVLDFSAQVGVTATSILTLRKQLHTLNVTLKLSRFEFVRYIAAYALFGTNTKKAAAAMHVMSQSFRSAQTAAIAAKVAFRGLMAATGIGIAVVALGTVVAKLAGSFDDAGASARDAADGMDEFGKEADSVKQAYDTALSSTYSDLMGQFEGLKQQWKSLSTTAEKMAWIKAHQSAFDDLRISVSDVSDAESIFNGNTDAVVEAFTRRAKAAARMAQLTELYRKQIALADEYAATQTAIQDDANKSGRRAKAGDEIKDDTYKSKRYGSVNQRTGKWEFSEQGAQLYSGTDVKASPVLAAIDKRMAANDAEIKKVEAQFAAEDAEAKKILRPGRKKKPGSTDSKGGNKGQIVKDPKTLEELRTNIDLSKKKLTGDDSDEQRKIQRDIQAWQKKADTIELAQKKAALPIGAVGEGDTVDTAKIETAADAKSVTEYLNKVREVTTEKGKIAEIDTQIAAVELRQAELQRPADPQHMTTIQDVSNELEYQRTLRKTAAKESQSQIDNEINRLEVLKKHIEDAAVIDMPDEALQTYDQLNIKLSYYRDQLSTSLTANRPAILQHIKDLEEIESRWQRADKAATISPKVEDAGTLKEIDAAISFYSEQQQTEDAAQIQKTQEIIDRLTQKKRAIQLGVELPQMQREVEEINALTGREYRLKIRAMGFDGIVDKIREINALMKNPDLTGGQMAQLEALRKSYAEWAKDAVRSFSTYRKGWDGVKGIGGGIEGITNALEGNGNAWQTLTGIVDGFLQIYDGISGIVELVNMLTMATNLQTGAKEAETAATAAGTAATIADTAATGADTAATMANTAAKSGEAITNATNEGAKMPFPLNLVAIAAGVAAVLAALAMASGFATGGVVGGNSPTGDKLFARVNSGEMILNKRQQLRLLQMLNGQRGLSMPSFKTPDLPNMNLQFNGSMLQPAAGGMSGLVRFEIDGRKLVGVMANETRVSSKSGKKTNIKIG